MKKDKEIKWPKDYEEKKKWIQCPKCKRWLKKTKNNKIRRHRIWMDICKRYTSGIPMATTFKLGPYCE